MKLLGNQSLQMQLGLCSFTTNLIIFKPMQYSVSLQISWLLWKSKSHSNYAHFSCLVCIL